MLSAPHRFKDNGTMQPHRAIVSILGKTLGRSPHRQFGIRQSDRLFHTYVIGQTGTGKSALLANLAIQDVRMGQGFCLVDPHGDLAGEVRTAAGERAIYWDIADPDCPYGYNPLTYVKAEYRPLIASGIIDTLKQQWADAWGARMEHLLRFAVLALLETPGSTLADIMPMYTDKSFRSRIVARVTDKEVRRFWHDEFPNMNYKNAADGVAPIANKLGAFLAHPVVRKAVCDPETPLRFRRIMDEGQMLVVNLAKGRLGTDIANVLGGLVVSNVMHAAVSRQDQPQELRRPFILYVDEFHSFTSAAFVGVLSEMRKYGLGLVVANQYTGQLKPEVLEAVFGNVGTLMSFRIGAKDAPIIAAQLGDIDPRDLINLGNYELNMKLMIDGVASKAFSAATLRRHRARKVED